MILKTVHVQHFKCIKDSTAFSIDPDVTCLVGKNESGKTALLQAIEKINPLDKDDAAFDTLEYPANEVTEYKQRAKQNPDDAIVTTWELEDEDVAAVEELVGKDVLNSRDLTITKGYYENSNWNFDWDEARAFEALLSSHELYDEERKALRETKSLDAAFKLIDAKHAPDSGEAENLRSTREQALHQKIQTHFPKNSFWDAIADILEKRLPKIVYFSEYLRLPGQLAVTDLKTRIANNQLRNSDRMFLALLSMIGRQPDELENIGEFEPLQRELEGVSAGLTKQIFEYWRQNRHLRVQFRCETALPRDPAPFNSGYVMRTRIENTRHGVTTRFDERSSGFVWFFSFLVWFGQVKKNYGDNLILLLDEPGMGLHAKAQADLLRYIDEKLANQFQVIYTTHSPFMISPSHLLRARTVEDVFIKAANPEDGGEELGTKVGDQILSTDRDTLFPLQACLGYEITQTLFIGEHCLLVEGPGEILYLPWFSRKLQSLGRIGLDKRWTLTPCGGADKVPAFLSLFGGQNLHVATLLDYATGHKNKIAQVRKNSLLLAGHVLTADQYADQSEADTEDIVGREAYVALVNQCYSLTGQNALPTAKPNDAPIRVVKEVEDKLRTVTLDTPEFDHYRPAEFLTQAGLGIALPGIDAALTRFESLFADLNALLPEEQSKTIGKPHFQSATKSARASMI